MQIIDLEFYAKTNNVPIIKKSLRDFLIDFIKENKITDILEIGCAIGYSAINMALVNKEIKITTIERNEAMYLEALKNIKNYEVEKQILIINDDALNVEITTCYDLIFIDAAKAQNINFFDKFQKNLKPNGYIIVDNLSFHGLINNDNITSRNVRGLIRKIKSFIEYLENNDEFITKFLDIGDGISISKRRSTNE